MNSKGLYFEYNNGTTSIPIPDPLSPFSQQNGLMQNFYLALDSDTLEEVDTEMTSSKAAVACIVQVADENRAWHYERSPYAVSRKVQSASASGDCGQHSYCYYANPSDTDIFTNFFYLHDWENQDPRSFDLSLAGDSDSKAVRRLYNMQNLAQIYSNNNDVNAVKTIMTTPLDSGGPFLDGSIIGAEDYTFFSSVADIKNRILHVNSQTNNNPSHWTAIYLNQYFLDPEITYLASRKDMANGRVRKN